MTPLIRIDTVEQFAARFPERFAEDEAIVRQIFEDKGERILMFNEAGRLVTACTLVTTVDTVIGRIDDPPDANFGFVNKGPDQPPESLKRYTGADRPTIDGMDVPFPCLVCRQSFSDARPKIGVTCVECFGKILLGPQRAQVRSSFKFTDDEITRHAHAIVAFVAAQITDPGGGLGLDVLAKHPGFERLLMRRGGAIVAKPPLPPPISYHPARLQQYVEDAFLVEDPTRFGRHVEQAPRERLDLKAILLGEPRMTAPVDEGLFQIHVLTPEEIAEAAKTRFESPAYGVTNGHSASEGSWTKGTLRMHRKDDGTWSFGFWMDAPPLCACTPVIDGVLWYWANNHPGLYHPIPEGYVMVTVGEIDDGAKYVQPFLIPADREAELREKVQSRPLPSPTGNRSEYGG